MPIVRKSRTGRRVTPTRSADVLVRGSMRRHRHKKAQDEEERAHMDGMLGAVHGALMEPAPRASQPVLQAPQRSRRTRTDISRALEEFEKLGTK